MIYQIDFTEKAKEDLAYFKKSGNNVLLKRLSKLLKEIAQQPYIGTGKPEMLKHDLKGKWSRRINREHRLVYDVKDNIIVVHSCKGHYS